MSDLNISVSQMQGKVPVTVLHIAGDIDADSHQGLDQKAQEVVDDGARYILLDLSKNEYMSSAGFRSMHKIHTALKNAGDESSCLKVLNPPDKTRRLMKTMGFDGLVPAFDDMDEAVNAF